MLTSLAKDSDQAKFGTFPDIAVSDIFPEMGTFYIGDLLSFVTDIVTLFDLVAHFRPPIPQQLSEEKLSIIGDPRFNCKISSCQ